MTPSESFFALKIPPSAKVVALHFAGTLDPKAVEVPTSPRICAEALGISRGEFERAWRECVRRKWMIGHSPTKLTMPAGVLPRLVLASLRAGVHDAPAAPSAPEPPSRPKETNEQGTRNHGTPPPGHVRGRPGQGAR
jgi:hypothetical protein